jgi:putative transposase
VPHARRVPVSRAHAVLVTMKMKREVWNLRARRAFERLLPSLAAARERFGVRITHFSVQRDHIHLIVEAASRAALSRAMQGLSVRIARKLNAMMGRKGEVFADRYHDRVLTTPRQVRHALVYVLGNARKHGVKLALRELDPCSSAAAFTGWCVATIASELAMRAAAVVAEPATWLLRVGWRRAGPLLDPDHRPGPMPAR